MQLVPNYAGPLDPRATGKSTSNDRPTELLYNGLIRYETDSNTFVFVHQINDTWVWQPLTSYTMLVDDTAINVYGDLNLVNPRNNLYVLGKMDVDGDLEVTKILENTRITSNTLTPSSFGTLANGSSININMVTSYHLGEILRGTTVATLVNNNGYNTVHKLLGKMLQVNSRVTSTFVDQYVQKSGDSMNGSLTVNGKVSIGTVDVGAQLDTLKRDANALSSRILDLERRFTALRNAHTFLVGTSLYSKSDFVSLGAIGEVVNLQFAAVYNPKNNTLFQNNELINLQAGTYRFRFTAQSTSDGVGFNDAFICSFIFSDAPRDFTIRGYNEWNTGGASTHQAILHCDRVYTRSSDFYMGVNLEALDGRILWYNLHIQKLNL